MPNLLSQAYQKPRETYNQPRLTSYAGYPVFSAQDLGLMDYFKNEGSVSGGMVWGGNKMPKGVQGSGSGMPVGIVPNPYLFKNNPTGYNGLVKLEASRIWMSENNYDPEFKITPEMQKWREDQFKGVEAGKYYLNDDRLFKETLVSRVLAGDEGVPQNIITKDLERSAGKVWKSLEQKDKASKPTITQSIMSAMGMKKK